MFRHLKVLLLSLFLTAPPLHAVEDPDQRQPIEIHADRLKASQKKGFAHYLGHVSVTQGKLYITGDTLTVEMEDGKVRRAVVTGTPARFKKFDYEKQRWIRGHATTITYQLRPERLMVLNENAHVTSEDGEQLDGALIRYYPDSRRLEAEGGTGRVKMVIPPSEEIP